MIDSAMAAADQPKTPLDRFAATLRSIVDQVEAVGATPVLATLTPVAEECYYDRHPEEWYPGGLTAVLARYDEAVRKVAAEAGVPLLELGRVVTPAGLRTPETCGVRDGVHLTPEGCREVAQAYSELLSPRLGAKP
jgi:lysophospholipase L1-like esterase